MEINVYWSGPQKGKGWEPLVYIIHLFLSPAHDNCTPSDDRNKYSTYRVSGGQLILKKNFAQSIVDALRVHSSISPDKIYLVHISRFIQVCYSFPLGNLIPLLLSRFYLSIYLYFCYSFPLLLSRFYLFIFISTE